MKFVQKRKLELGDTLVPDLFILNNLKSLQANEIKIYLYLLYALKSEKEIDSDDVNKALDITDDELKAGLEVLLAEDLVQKITKGYTVVDLKEAEINRIYTPKVEKTKKVNPELEERWKKCVEAISTSFFNGCMTLTWYTRINELFVKNGFSEDVVLALFQYCKERNALNEKYVLAVAATWTGANVKTFEDLEMHLENEEKYKKFKQKIAKALGLSRNLTKYEEGYVLKWQNEYKYNDEIIEEGLRRTTSTTNPSFKYIDAIISSWYKQGLKTLDDILEVDKPKETAQEKTTKKATISTEPKKKAYQNYSTKREYDSSEDFYDDI